MRPTYRVAAPFFLRLLGAVYLAAFVSLWVQVDGLIGSGGILPVASWLGPLGERLGAEAWWRAPTLFWLSDSDPALHLACGLGSAGSVLLLLGLWPLAILPALWLLYLSLTVAGGLFLGYQWDALLLETGLLAILLAPAVRRLRPYRPHRLGLFLCHWLLFRFMFSSGVVKLTSGDPTWRDLSALDYHYWTQPLPAWTGWLVAHLPAGFHAASAAAMFAVELVLPFLLFVPPWRRHAFWPFVLLQAGIAATGSYGFFNLLTIVLCLLLLDDAAWPEALRRRAGRSSGGRAEPRTWPTWLLAPVAAVLLAVSAVHLAGALGVGDRVPPPARSLARAVAPLRSVNGYGLFAVMTTERPEITVEGSRDGVTWKPYRFRYKPGDAVRRPPFATPHMPRLDWQLWFAALRGPRGAPWVERFLGRLVEGSPAVLGLLREDPFPGDPPRFVRARLWRYRPTDLATWRQEGRWWERERVGVFAAVDGGS